MTFSCKLKEITPIKILLRARPKIIGDDSELKMAQIPTKNCSTVRQIAPWADWVK
jgi:hypothetical protein